MEKTRKNLTICRFAYFVIIMLVASCQHVKVQQNDANKTIIWLQLSGNMAHPDPANYILNDNMELTYKPLKNTEKDAQFQSVFAMASNGYVKWSFYPSEPVKINYGFGNLIIVSPGDSIVIRYDGEEYSYFGKGADKLTCWNEMKKAGKKQAPPTYSNNLIKSIDDYLRWNKYLDNKLALQIPLLESYKDNITPFEYFHLKSTAINLSEDDRVQTFEELRTYSQRDPTLNITINNLKEIWDSTQNNSLGIWLRTQSEYFSDIYSLTQYNKLSVWRHFGFDKDNDSLASKELRNYLYYTHAKQNYKGLLRERILAYILAEQAIAKVDPRTPLIQAMLKDYYNQPGFPEYKKQVKALEEKIVKN